MSLYFAPIFLCFFIFPCVYSNLNCEKNCPTIENNAINVHLICHSHNDVGWLRTSKEYYRLFVKNIFDTVLESLLENSNRKYVHVESAYLDKWWNDQNQTSREQFLNLITGNQLEIVSGAWSMNDEATCHYQSIIDQYSLGLRTVHQYLGDCARPKIGWQIDSFGHSKTMAHILHSMKFDGLILARIDFLDLERRVHNKDTDFFWKTSSFNENSMILTSVLRNLYETPIEFPQLHSKRAPDLPKLLRYLEDSSKMHKTNNILVPIGGDFYFTDAKDKFKYLDLVIRQTNALQDMNGKQINMFYSTPECYIKSLLNSPNTTFSLKYGDFFPYTSNYASYWTGFYTSRPTIKRMEREANNLLQAFKQLLTFHSIEKKFKFESDELLEFQKAMGEMQHHDAITGTQRQHVAYDYTKTLHKCMSKSIQESSSFIKNIIELNTGSLSDVNLGICLLKNMSVCPEMGPVTNLIVLYNPLAQKRSFMVKIPVRSKLFSILNEEGKEVAYQVSNQFQNILDLQSVNTTGQYELVFQADDIPALGLKVYFVKAAYRGPQNDHSINNLTFGTDSCGFTLNPKTHNLKSITIRGNKLNVKQELMWYKSRRTLVTSGAYLFCPEGQANKYSKDPSIVSIDRGDLYDEIVLRYTSYAQEALRVYKNKNKCDYIEIDWMIGPLPEKDYGVEVISKFYTNVKSEFKFYTDSNGRDSMERLRNFRHDYTYSSPESISGNYYPVVNKISIKDDNLEFSILTDRPQGGSSLLSGSLELMMQRKLVEDDNLGVEEILKETNIFHGGLVRGQHYLTINKINDAREQNLVTKLILENHLQPLVFIGDLSNHYRKDFYFLKKNILWQWSGIKKDFPDSIFLLSFEIWKAHQILIRIENTSKNEKTQLIHLEDHFNFKIVSLNERTLDGNANIIDFGSSDNEDEDILTDSKNFTISLRPMEIRTFLMNIEKDS